VPHRLLRLVFVALVQAGPAAALDLAPDGPEEAVFVHARDACERWDIPDAPARAWRDHEGRVRLVAGADPNRAMVGPTLGAVRRDCAVIHRGARDDDPGAYDDRVWIAAVHTVDGRRVEALAHVEFHGHARPGLCDAGAYLPCWRNAVTQLVSEDGGARFGGGGRGALVAAAPRPYGRGQRARVGYFNPSNVVESDGWLHAFLFAERDGPQRRGVCAVRRPLDGGPSDWRAWDGRGFAATFADPHRAPPDDPARHVCAPLPGLTGALSGVVRHLPSGRWLAVTAMVGRDGAGAPVPGVWWTASDDLIAWDPPRLLLAAPLQWRHACEPLLYAYPTLMDDDGPSRLFDAADDRFWLYLTRMTAKGCRPGPERDLIRIPVRATGG
jgi:hypothetical protein